MENKFGFTSVRYPKSFEDYLKEKPLSEIHSLDDFIVLMSKHEFGPVLDDSTTVEHIKKELLDFKAYLRHTLEWFTVDEIIKIHKYYRKIETTFPNLYLWKQSAYLLPLLEFESTMKPIVSEAYKELTEWIVSNERTVFEDADISVESKRLIRNHLG